MLFNSYEFIFAFLPATLAVFFLLGRGGAHRMALGWLVAASLFFYGWWNPPYLLLIGASIGFNFLLGNHLARGRGGDGARRKPLLVAGVALNLFSIGYFKYVNFFVANVNAIAGTDYHLGVIVLPLAISFFTFQQITFLVDSYRGLTREQDFLNYCLFVTFFPQLIAGPIVHHSEMLPQFARRAVFRFRASNLAVGLTLFAIGLFKKAVMADGVAAYATPVFAAAETGAPVDFFTAWGGALAYTFQLYFDFSGYSDMALGGARMFGIRLPVNFNSPYKAVNIIDFWRRWHITLSRFLRDYVYIELGGNRRGPTRRHVNLMLTMLIGGLWHGAGWTFVIWGGLHGLYLIVNHGWHTMRRRLNGGRLPESSWAGRRCAQAITFLAVVVGWVFFRATSLDGAVAMLEGMAGLNGVSLPAAVAYRTGALAGALEAIGVTFAPGGGERFLLTWAWIAVLLPVALIAPNSLVLMRRYRPALGFSTDSAEPGRALPQRIADAVDGLAWRPRPRWIVGAALALGGGVLALPQVSEFLYYQF